MTRLGVIRSAIAVGLFTVALTHAVPAAALQSKEWRFTVLLDDSEIGYHRFVLTDGGGQRELRSEARFNVKFLFFNAYAYVHDNIERWDGSCLERIRANTNDNGERLSVSGERKAGRFVIATPQGEDVLPGCVMTFAYWNPDFLGQRRLLNAQTGEYVDVDVSALGADTVRVRGQAVAAYRYAVTGEKFRIDLWYSPEHEWLALESATEGGRRLRYQIQ